MKYYKHYKGNIYEFLFVAIHSETEERLVIYKNKEGQIFARPYNMFFEIIEVDGELVQRFKEVE
ncbi:hypothetical protein CN931_17975 [Bacillus sp. AFS054943]|uniref:DUF1653 domain-containing protein n=1 Tax=Bacillus TaxID=1386 RepID=UPI0005E150BB|nr:MULTISPECIES: DUF1653 domain-containing protein [Bacillus]CEY43978.1 Uncharacterized protein conserved in bacteria [Streptococcus pneumoniae]MDY7962536.1 DUF1653 domain-containing protein [Bacillus thuringiensis]PGL80920.1 hypothetical protein CN931_17975 [Bacillus sp. AFS054943]TNP01358.1 DUF1653 domain-containing protein [Bacillus cereus]UNT70720.1 DUF1653 domain-containing protein [Bacillus sp. N447-1]